MASSGYGPNDDIFRIGLWEEFKLVRAQWEEVWCVVGGFNVIRYPSERLDCNMYTAMHEFSNVIT